MNKNEPGYSINTRVKPKKEIEKKFKALTEHYIELKDLTSACQGDILRFLIKDKYEEVFGE